MNIAGSPKLKRLGLAGAGAVALGVVVYMAYARVYAGPMREAREDLATWRRAARAYERDLEPAAEVRARVREVAGTTLGKSEEEVAHRFRSLLHEAATMAGLAEITVSEGRTSVEANPATSGFRLQGFDNSARRTSDFSVMNGDVRGVGTLDAVARMLALCDAQAWIHRVSGFSVTPVNDARDRFELKVSAATLILPDMGPPEGKTFAVTPLGLGAEEEWASIVSKNVFRVPEVAVAEVPVVVEVPAIVESVPAGPPPQPYHEWRLAGVMEGARGASVVMVHVSGGMSVSVAVGETVLDARLVGATGEEAVFEVDGGRFGVRLGQSLADRSSVEQMDQ